MLIGAGNLGRALMAYKGFDAKGFRLVAVFDSDPAKIGKRQGPFAAEAGTDPAGDKRFFVVQPLSELRSVVEKQGIRLAILAVPGDSTRRRPTNAWMPGFAGC